MQIKPHQNQVRIITGQWRGRKINFPDLPGLRPSSDRVRETLFNWLMNDIVGAHCLDLFAGSGVLGLEALSRGAAKVVAVDQSLVVIKALHKNAELLKTNQLKCICGSWSESLLGINEVFDLVFLDPPFKQGLIKACCDYLEDKNLLAPNAWIYLEMEISADLPKVPESWELYRDMKTQQVRVILYKKGSQRS